MCHEPTLEYHPRPLRRHCTPSPPSSTPADSVGSSQLTLSKNPTPSLWRENVGVVWPVFGRSPTVKGGSVFVLGLFCLQAKFEAKIQLSQQGEVDVSLQACRPRPRPSRPRPARPAPSACSDGLLQPAPWFAGEDRGHRRAHVGTDHCMYGPSNPHQPIIEPNSLVACLLLVELLRTGWIVCTSGQNRRRCGCGAGALNAHGLNERGQSVCSLACPPALAQQQCSVSRAHVRTHMRVGVRMRIWARHGAVLALRTRMNDKKKAPAPSSSA